ncbi:hypothetical protein BI364_04585 [Acidihalobacter yilgarnensis]|uniref:Uncharacterized protein n=1 Tax=Acidihalobacter yilgarnensis TaxID=2819280 RepID=A0A1D8ILL6_9GAMM|nr:hypothetical protein BI364_04585 [Acidihalobacter yilgarnensis]
MPHRISHGNARLSRDHQWADMPMFSMQRRQRRRQQCGRVALYRHKRQAIGDGERDITTSRRARLGCQIARVDKVNSRPRFVAANTSRDQAHCSI